MRTIRRILLAGILAWTEIIQADPPGGSLDPSFRVTGGVSSFALQTDGKILVAGSFTNLNGTVGMNLARFHPTGSLDESFTPATEVAPGIAQGPVRKVGIQLDGKILIVGAFARVNGVERPNIARLQIDGTLDASFTPVLHDGVQPPQISGLTVQPDQKILLGGTFTVANGTTRKSLSRLNVDGSLDESFAPFAEITNEQVWVYDIALQTDGKILVYGRFVTTREIYRHYLFRLHPDGTKDTSFAANTSHEVEIAAIQ